MTFASRLFSSAESIPAALRVPLASLPFLGMAAGYGVASQSGPARPDAADIAGIIMSGDKSALQTLMDRYGYLGDPSLSSADLMQKFDQLLGNHLAMGVIAGFIVGGILMFAGAALASRAPAH
jgi:hypothetical protein